jgi:hypothetical protein
MPIAAEYERTVIRRGLSNNQPIAVNATLHIR